MAAGSEAGTPHPLGYRAIFVNGGILSIIIPNALPAAGTITVNTGASAQTQSAINMSRSLALNGQGVSSAGALHSIGGNSIWSEWFNGRIDFSPPVPELADQGFPLAGGRLDSINGKTVAAIVYHRRLHTVNLFVWPAKDSADRSFAKDGFAVNEWSRNGLRFAAVSDIPTAELKQFQGLFEKRSA